MKEQRIKTLNDSVNAATEAGRPSRFRISVVLKIFVALLLFDTSADFAIKIISKIENNYFYATLRDGINVAAINDCVKTIASDASIQNKYNINKDEIFKTKSLFFLVNLTIKLTVLYVCSFFITKKILGKDK